jgi:hypothetical protein
MAINLFIERKKYNVNLMPRLYIFSPGDAQKDRKYDRGQVSRFKI